MNKLQWVIVCGAVIIVIGLYAATEKQFFGTSTKPKKTRTELTQSLLSTDSILFHSKENLSAEQITRLNFLEHSISRGDVKDQQVHIYHQLAHFWSDTAKVFAPYAWYTAEAARLENSEKSLTFAAHLFLNNLTEEGNPQLKQWEAFQSKDLFERSLKLDPNNDSSKVGLGATYIYGGIAMPMQGIGLIKEVVAKDSTNIYAQMTLGQASILSGQLDKAIERFKLVSRLQPQNWEPILLVAEVAEQMENKTEAIDWYQKSLPLINVTAIKQEVEARIAKLKK